MNKLETTENNPENNQQENQKGIEKLTTDSIKQIQGVEPAADTSFGRPWDCHDGTASHTIVTEAIYDRYDDPENNRIVRNGETVTIKDKENQDHNGRIDTWIDSDNRSIILEYKTNDMSKWNISDAERLANEHGTQLQSYLQSPDVPSNAEGYLIANGRPSSNPDVMECYQKTLEEKFQVKAKFPKGGGMEDIYKEIDDILGEN